MSAATHWDGVYVDRGPTNVSWYEADPADSLDMIGKAGLAPTDRILDVGAGASHLAGALLAQGHTALVLADISALALDVARRRLGDAADVKFLVGDVLKLVLPEVALWHDRALFHFLGSPAERSAYRRQAIRSVQEGGFLLVATFAEDGPAECSGLPVTRYSADSLAAEFAPEFEPVANRYVIHTTPAGKEQAFTYCLLKRSSKGEG